MEGGLECVIKRDGTPQSAEAPMAKAQRSTCKGVQGTEVARVLEELATSPASLIISQV